MPSSTSSSEAAAAQHDEAAPGSGRQSLVVFMTCLAAGLLACFAASEALLRRWVAPQENLPRHARLLQSSTAGDAAFGDSHTARGFLPPSQMVNLAFPSEGVPYMDWKVRTYFAERSPGRVIIQADPHLFAPYRLARRPPDYSERMERMESGADEGWMVFSNRQRAQLPAYWNRFLTGGFQLTSTIVQAPNGALLSPGDLSLVPERMRQVEARQRIVEHSQTASPLANAFRKQYSQMLDFLAAKDAHICLAGYPVSPDYRAAFHEFAEPAAKAERLATQAFFAAEAKRVGGVYVNLEAAIDDRSAFRDVDHLNAAATPLFSKALMQACFGDNWS